MIAVPAQIASQVRSASNALTKRDFFDVRSRDDMSPIDHQRYYAERAETERALAHEAKNPLIARLHEDFAVRYEVAAGLTETMLQRPII